jgi:ABC-2 family transporter protein
MTALTGPAQPGQDAGLRPVPWRRMAWVTWRQHCLMLAGVVAVLGGAGLYLLKTGLDIHQAFAAVAANCPPRCNSRQQSFGILATQYSSGMPGMILIAGLLQVVPALIGAFAGAPVLAREFETGTFRYTWTQGFGRARWAAAKLALLALAVAAIAGAFSLVFSWCYGPIIGLPRYSALGSTTFDLRGVVLAAWTLAAFAIGALAGVLIRRVVPAMAATLATWTGLALAAGLYLRRHYEAPLVTSHPNVAPSAWVVNQWWARGGKPVSLSAINQVLQRGPGGSQVNGSVLGSVDPAQYHYLIQHGFTQWTSYQPASRFWPFQFIEGGWLLALSLLLIAATVWLVHRRAA